MKFNEFLKLLPGLEINHINFGKGVIEKIQRDENHELYLYIKYPNRSDLSEVGFFNSFEHFIKLIDNPKKQEYINNCIIKHKKIKHKHFMQMLKENELKEKRIINSKKHNKHKNKNKNKNKLYTKNTTNKHISDIIYEYSSRVNTQNTKEQKILNNKIKHKQKYIDNQKEFFIKKHEKEFPYSTFLTYQGKTWNVESKEQILCIHKEYDRKVPFWDIITELKTKDIILHCRGQLLVAISRVITEAYDSDEDDYGNSIKSLKVNTNYILLKNPINLQEFRLSIKAYNDSNKPFRSPFNKHGKGNQGYIYPIDLDLAQAFIYECVNQNNYLLDIDYIQEILDKYNYL